MRRVRIGEVTAPVDTWNPQASGSKEVITYVDISSVDSVTKTVVEPTRITASEAPSRARQLLKAGDTIVSTVRPGLNAVALVTPELDGATASTGFCVLRPDRDEIDDRYLFHWVRTEQFVRHLEGLATGASYPAVSDTVVRESRIPLPSMTEQGRIAERLDRADAVRRKREQSRRLVDELLRSVFLEMFGDPVRNEKGWEAVPLEAIADIASGVTIGRRLDPTRDLREVPYIRVANVQDGFLSLSEIKTTIATHEEAERYALRANDILLTEGGDPDKLGRGAVWDGGIEPCIHQNHVFRVRLRERGCTAEYLNALLGSPYGKRYFFKAAKQTTGIASINRTQLGRFPVLIAPSELQERFALAKRGIDKLSAQVDRSCEEIVVLRSGMSGLLLAT